jgi:hypothetical protein
MQNLPPFLVEGLGPLSFGGVLLFLLLMILVSFVSIDLILFV